MICLINTSNYNRCHKYINNKSNSTPPLTYPPHHHHNKKIELCSNKIESVNNCILQTVNFKTWDQTINKCSILILRMLLNMFIVLIDQTPSAMDC
jgi:hypothetical protein